jgi:hypothetical protein
MSEFNGHVCWAMSKDLKADNTPKIDITPEMIEAGALIIACYSGREDDPSETAIEVFRAMERARTMAVLA